MVERPVEPGFQLANDAAERLRGLIGALKLLSRTDRDVDLDATQTPNQPLDTAGQAEILVFHGLLDVGDSSAGLTLALHGCARLPGKVPAAVAAGNADEECAQNYQSDRVRDCLRHVGSSTHRQGHRPAPGVSVCRGGRPVSSGLGVPAAAGEHDDRSNSLPRMDVADMISRRRLTHGGRDGTAGRVEAERL